MSFQQTTASGFNDLVDKLYTFAVTTDGWTGVYNAIADEGSTRQIGVEKGNCHVAVGARSGENPTGDGDAIVNLALSTALLSGVGQRKYYGHTGSLVATATDADRIMANDLAAASFPNVWFFSGSGKTHVHCVVQTAGDRYSHFGFGVLDKAGMTHADVAFALSAYYEWWTGGAANDPASSVHSIGHISESESQVYVPSGVLPAWSGPSGGAVFAGLTQLTKTMTRVRQPNDHYSTAVGKILDFFFAVNNQSTTGGTALYGLPVLFRETAALSHLFLGYLPEIRLVNMGQHTPGETILFGSEEWLVFPWRRKGLRENLVGGSNPIDAANTAEYGLALKRVP